MTIVREFRIGDKVTRMDDPRHIGRIEAIVWSQLKVRWENGWLEMFDQWGDHGLIIVERAPGPEGRRVLRDCSTIRPSPLRRWQQRQSRQQSSKVKPSRRMREPVITVIRGI